MRYPSDDLTPSERARLAPHVTDLDGPVFALVNLPETVKGALFARYSRYPGTLRRLFLDEFADSLPDSGGPAWEAEEGRRAAELYERIFVGYGDDSVAQLGGAHVACEWVSNILTKTLQRPRLAAYLEQSTRYIAYDAPMPGGGYRYYRSPELGPAYEAAMDALFDAYAEALPRVRALGRRDVPARGGRAGGRAPAGRERQGARPPARAAAGRLALAHGHLRDRPGVRAADPAPDGRPAAGGARLRPDDPRRDQGDDAELRRARRAAGSRRRVGRLSRAPPRRHRALGGAARARPPGGGAGCRPVGPAAARRRRRGAAAGRLAVRGRRGRRGDDARGRPRAERGRARARARRSRRRPAQPPPPPGPRLRGAPLPVRGGVRLRRVPRPPAPPDADRPVAGPDARSRRRHPGGGRGRRLRRPLRERARALAHRVRAPRRRRAWSRPRPTRSASATACATCST